jgi:glycosyltransferase involved in cell wall biosynthesis
MKKKMTVWCISKYAAPPQYGVGARLFYIAREFCNMGLNVLLISSDANHLARYPIGNQIYNFEKYNDLVHLWIKTYKYTRSASLKRFISWLDFEYKLFRLDRSRYEKPDVVIISSLSLFSIMYGIYLKRVYDCKLVFEIRDIHPLILIEEFGVSKWNPMVLLLGMLERIGYKRADLIVGTMPNLKEHVLEVIGYDKEVFHSPIGIHEIWFNDVNPSESVGALFPEAGKFVVGYAGSMGISNALDPFFEVIKRLSDEEDIYFVLVGDGDLKPCYLEKVEGLRNVRIGPKINQKDIPYFLSRCDLLYLATHDSKVLKYGQSLNKLVDYMMAGKPVVASYSGYQSMLNEANAGLFVPAGDPDAIIEAIYFFKNMDPYERNLYGVRGKSWVEKNHDYKTLALRYYNKIMEMF